MADRLLKEYLYDGVLAAPTGYTTDFALGMTYSLGFDVLLGAHLAFGMLGEAGEEELRNPTLLLAAITGSSDRVVVLCNKGQIAVPRAVSRLYPLLERNIFEVYDKKNIRANFHPKLWLIREKNNDNPLDLRLKLIVSSRNMADSDHLDCVVCLRGCVDSSDINPAHRPLAEFIRSAAAASNITAERLTAVSALADDLERVSRFEVDAPFDDYDFMPTLFGRDFGNENALKCMEGTARVIISPFIDKSTLRALAAKSGCALLTRKEYVDREIFDMFSGKGGIFVARDELVTHGMDLHAKMYHIWRSRSQQYLLLGSANATTSAFSRNGELLLRLRYRSSKNRADELLAQFYEEGNGDSRFEPLRAPLEHATPDIRWDEAEGAMKTLMCADDLRAVITRHRDGLYSATVTSRTRKFDNGIEVSIAPLQKKEMAVRWSGRASFDNLKAADLSEFYILSAQTAGGTRHQAVVKIETSGLPDGRDGEIHRELLGPDNFMRFIELLLSDSPLLSLRSEEAQRGSADGGSGAAETAPQCGLYEILLRAAASSPNRLHRAARVMESMSTDAIPEEFKSLFQTFSKVVKR